VGQIIISGQTIQPVWDQTVAVLKLYGEPTAAALVEFQEWRELADRLRVKRNLAIHGHWMRTTTGEPMSFDVFSRKARGVLQLDLFPGGLEELQRLVTDLVDCRNAFATVALNVSLARLAISESHESPQPPDQQQPDPPLD
jgi:hypothetical protein